jgi:exonuclease SbcC
VRPLRLELKGFTAFRDEQAIDFEGLDLFAIAGPTGSGKTSILDAITYALFGYIERVGKHAGEFVSQGQTRLAVLFEFAVDDSRYRVTRRTTAKGVTDVRLDRRDADGWIQAGEGSDKVGGVNALIREAIGLDYDAFTRTVLLPQGRFAEFLVGDAKERREILTDLLGLQLFERLARRAGECKRSASAEAAIRARLLETEYAGVTTEAVAAAETSAARAADRETRVAGARRTVDAIAARGVESARSVRDLRTCGAEVRGAAGVVSRVAEELGALTAEMGEVAEVSALAVRRAEEAAAAARAAAAALRKAEGSWGRARDLTATRVEAEALTERRRQLADLRAEADHARAALPTVAAAFTEAEEALAVRVAEAEATSAALDGARTAVEDAAHADHVAAVRSTLASGDACPVCGGRIGVLPKTRGAPPLERAKASLAKAERAAAEAAEASEAARAARDAAERDVREAEREVERRAKEVGVAREDVARREARLREAFGGRLPKDPLATLEERLGTLEELESAREDADAAAAQAREEEATVAARRRELETEVATRRARLEGLALRALLDRAGALGEGALDVPEPPSLREAAEIAEVEAAARRTAGELRRFAEELDHLAETRAGTQTALRDEAVAAVEGLVVPHATLEELVEAVALAHETAVKEAATASQRAEQLAEKLAHAATLVQEVAEHRRREERFDALAKELRADRIIAFLQLEALELLAAAGSARLGTLSSGRYRLEFVGDEFFVVDTWNGEERRSARTLSGGETFLASLALALALSEQVGALSVTEKARLDSLFLDEGFGTLDPETLEVVVEAIEQLGGDGRVVGVITHVPELAVRLPARIEVEKSPRGSRLRVVT